MEEYYDSDNSIDNEEEGGEWITEDNLYKHMTHADTESLLTPEIKEGEEVSEEKPQVTGEAIETKETEDKVVEKVQEPVENQWTGPQHVVFLTSDFAMQNVIIQMGFTLLSLDGYRLTRVKRFKLLCRACK
jgi:rRNA maturation endonuclease Nob1